MHHTGGSSWSLPRESWEGGSPLGVLIRRQGVSSELPGRGRPESSEPGVLVVRPQIVHMSYIMLRVSGEMTPYSRATLSPLPPNCAFALMAT